MLPNGMIPDGLVLIVLLLLLWLFASKCGGRLVFTCIA